MKTLQKELEIDFIGGQEPLTVQEEKALSEYFKSKKNDKATNVKTQRQTIR